MKKKWKAHLPTIILALFGLLIGFCLAFLEDFYGLNLQKGNILFVIILLIISFYLHIIIHELGHLIFGLLTGYKFSSFRIGSLLIKKEEGSLKIKRYQVFGTGGQCLMLPPEIEDYSKLPYKLYNLGGIIMNFIFSIINLIIFFIFLPEGIVGLFLLAFSAIGIFTSLINAIPLEYNNMTNDGINQKVLRDIDTRKSFALQLKMNNQLMDGLRYKDMDIDFENLKFEGENNHINCFSIIAKFLYYFDKLEFKKAENVLKEILEGDYNLAHIHRLSLVTEKAFLYTVNGRDKEDIDRLYTKEIKTYMKSLKFDISTIRQKYTYELLVNKDYSKAELLKDKFFKNISKSPFKAQIENEIEIMNYLDKFKIKEDL